MSRPPAPVPIALLASLSCVAWLTAARADLRDGPTHITTGQDAAATTATLTDAQIEQFLLNAKVLRTHGAGKGVTGSLRATLSDGTITHDAHIQMIDESQREFRGTQGTEFNFRDSWTFNVAAYRINRLLAMNLVPVSVERHWQSRRAAYTWWVDDVMMDEGQRLQKKMEPPDVDAWNQQMQMVRLFDQLIANVDRNLGNLIITKTWRLWAIDHTRAFRTQPTLKTPGNIRRCDRQVFEKLKQLDMAALKQEVGAYLQKWDMESLLKRRDAIVAIIEKEGPAGLFDRK
jgi:hypothetical protein